VNDVGLVVEEVERGEELLDAEGEEEGDGLVGGALERPRCHVQGFTLLFNDRDRVIK
jgi:hypothetical protein